MTLTGHQKGLQAERWAALLLRLKGYRILAERFRTPVGEIDLVAKRVRTVAFVEVKRRKREEAAAEAIDARGQGRIRQAAELYLQRHPHYNGCDFRFDVVVMAQGKWPRHITGAF